MPTVSASCSATAAECASTAALNLGFVCVMVVERALWRSRLPARPGGSASSAAPGPRSNWVSVERRCVAALTALTFLVGFCLGFLLNGQRVFGWAWIGHVLPADQRQQLIFTVGPYVEMALLLLFVLHFLSLLPVFWRLRVRVVMTVQWDDEPSSASLQSD
jgi:hypothetical protein